MSWPVRRSLAREAGAWDSLTCMATDPGATGVGRWDLELFDQELALLLVAPDAGPASGIRPDALVHELVGLLEQRGVLSRSPLADDPVEWDSGGSKALWRLVETDAIWRVHHGVSPAELLVARGAGDVTLLSPPGGFHGTPEGTGLLNSYAQLSRYEPYGRADSALSSAIHRIKGPDFDIGLREPLEFDETFRRRPEEALFQAGFSVEPRAGARYLARLLHVYDLEYDFLDRPLPRHDVLADARLVAMWVPALRGGASARPTVLLLMSIDDEPTQRLLPHLERAADDAGYALTPIFALTRWSRQDVTEGELTRRLEQAWSEAGGPVAGLVVHYGATFSTHPSQYRAALTAFQAGHPNVPLASEALLGERGGQLHGVGFDQPTELDFLLEQLGF